MTLPDREEIAEILYATWTRPKPGVIALHDEGPVPPWEKAPKSLWYELADAILARLRPAWDEITQLKARTWKDAEERNALRADLAEERKIVDRVWKALGVETYEAASGKSIDALVADLRAERDEARRTCDELRRLEWLRLEKVITSALAEEREACAKVAESDDYISDGNNRAIAAAIRRRP